MPWIVSTQGTNGKWLGWGHTWYQEMQGDGTVTFLVVVAEVPLGNAEGRLIDTEFGYCFVFDAPESSALSEPWIVGRPGLATRCKCESPSIKLPNRER